MCLNAAKVITIVALFGFIALSVTTIHEFGAPDWAPMDDYFIENGQMETGSNSIISAILFDYRGLDTLGEASVLFAAASAIFLLFREAGKNGR